MAEGRDKVGVKVSQLSGDNFVRWRIELEDVLKGHGLWRHASEKTRPVPKPEGDADLKQYLEWESSDSKARSIIRRTLDDVTFNHVQDCKTSEEILTRIKQLRDPKTTDVLMTSMTAFFEEKWTDHDDVTSFMARLAVTSGKVNSCEDKDVKLTDKFTIAKTLASLPGKYTSFINSWYMISKKDSKLEDFREKLLTAERVLAESERRKDHEAAHETVDEASDALVVRNRRRFKKPHGSSGSSGSRPAGECFNCGQHGHGKAECRNMGRELLPEVME